MRLILSISCFLSILMFLSTHNNRFVCVPLFLFHLSHGSETVDCGSIFWPWLQGPKPIPPMAGTATKERGECQGWVWAAGYLRKEQLVSVWLWNWKISEEYEHGAEDDKPVWVGRLMKGQEAIAIVQSLTPKNSFHIICWRGFCAHLHSQFNMCPCEHDFVSFVASWDASHWSNIELAHTLRMK